MSRTKTLRILAAGLAALAAFGAASCASTGSAGDGLSLQEAVEQAAKTVAEKLPPKTRVAIVNFDSESPELSEYVMAELEAALYDNGVTDIADRRNLDFVRKELNLQISGEVSDASGVSIGQFLGAQAIVTGELVSTGDGYRFRLSAVNVETAAREVSTRLNVHNDKALQNLAAALGKGKKPAEAVAAASAALKAMEQAQAAPQRAGAYLDRGIAAAVRGDWNTAIAEFTGALRLDPDYAAAYLLRGMALLASVSTITAISENFEDFASLSETFSETEKPVANRAIDDLTEAIGLNPEVRTYIYRGNVYNGLGEYDKAIADYEHALKINPNFAGAMLGRGIAYGNKGDYDRAIADYTEAIRLDPNYAMTYNDRAIADFNQALKLAPDSAADLYNSRGWNYALKGDYKRALEDANKSLEIRPNDANTLDTRATAYQGLGDLNRAIADWEAAVKLAPDDAEFREKLEKAKKARGR